MDPTFDASAADILRRSWIPLRRFFEALGRAEPERDATGFLGWLESRGLPARLDLSLGSVRQQLQGLLNLFVESRMGIARSDAVQAAQAFEKSWWRGVRDRAVERMKTRCLAGRRIVPFLVYQRRIENPADLASQMGLSDGEVREYLREVQAGIRAEARAELDQDREPPEALDQLPET